MEIDKLSLEENRDLGKEFFFHHNGDMEKRSAGLRMLISAHEGGDPEATYIVARLILDSVLKPVKGNPEEYALGLMCGVANNGYVQARAFLNFYCESRYKKSITSKTYNVANSPLTDFDGKKIKIDRKGVLSPVDAVLKYENGKNVLTLSTNIVFVYSDEMENSRSFEDAVLKGIMLWQGEYEVFGGQKVSVKLNVTSDKRIYDNLIIMPLTRSFSDAILSMADVIGTSKGRSEMKNIIESKRSFAVSGLKWSVNSRKIIYMQSENGKFDDYEEIMHVAKHEFGHAIGLGDLYQSQSDLLTGVEMGTYAELDSYMICDKFYNLVMCDHHGPISNNDIEMVILAFRENRMQLFQPRRLKGKISSALGKGN